MKETLAHWWPEKVIVCELFGHPNITERMHCAGHAARYVALTELRVCRNLPGPQGHSMPLVVQVVYSNAASLMPYYQFRFLQI
jgi:hypothetical protein